MLNGVLSQSTSMDGWEFSKLLLAGQDGVGVVRSIPDLSLLTFYVMIEILLLLFPVLWHLCNVGFFPKNKKRFCYRYISKLSSEMNLKKHQSQYNKCERQRLTACFYFVKQKCAQLISKKFHDYYWCKMVSFSRLQKKIIHFYLFSIFLKKNPALAFISL